ncbi:MAG: 50S ribosomal protein L25 [Patescibacteria group bacterium]
MFEIKAKKRDLKENLETLRKGGEIPAVFYGMGKDTTSISIPTNEFKKVWKHAGESSAVKLTMTGANLDVLIHDVGVNPITGEPIHVDFMVIDANKTVEVSIPLEFTGVAPAVKAGLGVLVKVLHEVEVEALPKDLPQSIVIDISSLVDLDSQISVSEVVLPKGVTMVTKGVEIVASIAAQKEEKEETPVDLSAIEVEKKGKKEEEAPEA